MKDKIKQRQVAFLNTLRKQFTQQLKRDDMTNKETLDLIPEIRDLYKDKRITLKQVEQLSGFTLEQQKFYYKEFLRRSFLERENKKLEREICRLKEISKVKTSYDFDENHNTNIRTIINEMKEYFGYINADIDEFGYQKLPKTLQTLEDFENFIHEKLIKMQQE